MIIPNRIRVGSTFYTVKAQATPIVMNGMQCYGYCDPNMHEILLDAGLISDEQTMEQTFCHHRSDMLYFFPLILFSYYPSINNFSNITSNTLTTILFPAILYC